MAHVPHPQRHSLARVLARQSRQARTQGAASHANHTALEPGGVFDVSEGRVEGLDLADVPVDTTPPPVLAAPTLNLSMGAVGVRWNGVGASGEAMPEDFDHAAVEYRMGTDPWEATQPIAGGAGGVVLYGLPEGTVQVRLVGVDTTGNRADPSGVASIDVVPIETAEDVRREISQALVEADHIVRGSTFIDGILLKDGAVTAEKMNFVREGTRARLRIVPEGIILESNRADGAEVFRLDGESPLTWSVMDAVTGDVVAAVSEDGEFSGAGVHAGESLTWRGTSMDEYLWNTPWGIRYRGLRGSNPAASSTSSTHVQPFMRLEWQALKGRQYEVRIFNLTMTASAETLKARMMLREAVGTYGGGIRATMASSVTCTNYSGRRLAANAAQLGTFEVKYKYIATANADVSNLFCWSAWGGTGSVNISTSSSDPVYFEVVDLGPYMDLETAGHGSVPLPNPVVPPTAVNMDGATSEGGTEPTPPAETRTYTETWTATAACYWRGSSRNTGQMIQGYTAYDPGGGTKEGLAVFGSGNRYGQTMAAALTGATVEKIEVYVYFDHWYSASGGSAGIALHGTHGTLPSSSTLGGIVKTQPFKRGEGKWITLSSTYFAGFKSGTYRGFGIKAGSTSSSFYGTAYGGTGNWKTPKIRITYTK